MGLDSYVKPTALPEKAEIVAVMERAKNEAITDALSLDMKCNYSEAVCNVIIPNSWESIVENEAVENEQRGDNKTNDDASDDAYLSEDDATFIQKDLSILSSVENLELNNYETKAKKYNIKSKRNSPYIPAILKNNKIVTIRKTSLCWLFSEKHGRLSSDRLLRVKGLCDSTKKVANKKKTRSEKKKRKPSKKNIKQDQTDSTESEYSEECSYTSESEFENESFQEDEQLDEPQGIETEKYYAVAYSDRYHIGRVIKIEENLCSIKFLEQFMDIYRWPAKPEMELVEKKFIIYGPIHFKKYPFKLSRSELQKITKLFKKIKV